MWKGFRASISHDWENGQVGLSSDVYSKVWFSIVLDDLSCRYDATNARWTPVEADEAPRYVLLGAKVMIAGGVRPLNPLCNCKIMKNGDPVGHYEANMPVSGTNGPNAGMPGTAEMQATLGVLANPGDFFEVWAMVSAADMPQPFPSRFGCPTTMIDPHYAHTYFWGITDLT
jgi:hypothetical protein